MTPNKGDIIWAKYQGKSTQYNLLLFLGTNKEDVYAVRLSRKKLSNKEETEIPLEEIAKFKANLELFRNGSVKEVAAWLKQNTPIAYSRLRRYNGTKLFLINNYGPSGIKDLK